MHLTAIVAMTPDRIIGRDGGLPWHLPGDLKFFKRTTSGHPIVMGRKTYDSIGRPLPKRQNIVLTRDRDWSAEGIEVIHDPGDLSSLDLLDPHVFIIGGAQVYELFLPRLDDLLVTRVHEAHPGDTRFPEFESRFPRCEVLETHDAFEVRHYTRRDDPAVPG
ncbi:MAG: dihydrofolate reductase [Akkermansiaceae bacterium]|nr:dihydrofolate reductase [Akkermansiaceae bacterium]NNM29259.1 dihydrofolate reductase [Akkermansiaceae bacterium]